MKKILTILLVLFGLTTFAQLNVTTTMNATQLVQNILVGNGVTVSNVTFSGLAGSIGDFGTGPIPTNLGIDSGIIMSTGLVDGTTQIGSPVGNFASSINSTGSDPQLQTLIPSYTINDACVLQFDFIPLSDTIKFRYVFGSEEYPEWVGSSFNDVFGFFVSGPNPMGGNYTNKNIALIPGTVLPVTIDNVNISSNAMYYVDNQGINGQTIVYDGFTTVLTAWCLVVPCIQYHIKLAIGDAGDSSYDSGVFLEANSFSTNAVSIQTFYTVPLAGTDAVEGCSDAIISFQLPNVTPNPYVISYSIMGTATNGTDYTLIPNSVTIPAGQDSINIIIHPFLDGVSEGTETVSLIVQTSICGGTDTVTINIMNNNPLTSTSSNDTTICGGSANICVYPSGGWGTYTYNWSNGVTTQCNTVSPPVTTTFNVTVTDVCGATTTESVTIYYGTGSADAGLDDTICSGEFTSLSCLGGTSWLWSNGETTQSILVNPVTTTDYYVTAYGTCNAYDTVTVVVNPLPVMTINATTTNIYNGDPTTISTGGANSYVWSSNPSDPSLSNQIYNPDITVYPQLTTTYVVIGNLNGCTASISITINVTQVLPEISFIGYPLEGCEPLLVHFRDSSDKVLPGATYFWEFGDGNSSTLINPDNYYEYHGSYDVTLTITNPGGYSSTMTYVDYVVVHPKPIAIFDLTPNNTISIIDSVFWFFDQSVGLDIVDWNWDFGDGSTSNLENPFHSYSDTGSFTVTLIVTTEYGCIDTNYAPVVVIPEPVLYIPNAFTPNGDGRNDFFFIKGEDIIEFNMRIFDRWGDQIFFTTDINNCWDGKYKGDKLSNNTFVYIIEYTDVNYNVGKVKGTVTTLY